MALIWRFYGDSELGIAFDSGKCVIESEYRQNLQDNEMYQKWRVAMFQSHQVSYVSGKLDAEIKRELKNRGFHEAADQVFVAVALNSDRNLVSEDSDYGKGNEARASSPKKQEVLRYMTEDRGLNIMDSAEGLEFVTSANKKIRTGAR